MNNNLEKYSSVFINSLDITELELTSLKYKESTNWDSMRHIGLVSNLEDAFNISLDADDIFAITSYQEGIQVLEKYQISMK